MKLVLGSDFEDAYAVPQCQAITTGGAYVWERPHQCPWRGRYRIQSVNLCGQHIKMREVDLVNDILVPMRRARA